MVSHAEPLDPTNPRLSYELNALRLALERTRPSHGDFQLEEYPYSSRARIIRGLVENQRHNDLHAFGYSTQKEYLQSLAYVKFPVFLGVLGYRVCFVSDQAKTQFSQIRTAVDLKQFTLGQGLGWSDSFVLKNNGVDVVEFDGVPRLIRMTAENQVHAFCRGINEIKDEYLLNSKLKGLNVDKSIALYYPHPRFFFTHKNNQALIQRLELGFDLAFRDGSLLELFLKSHAESLRFVDMPSRHVIPLDNPFLEDLSFDYGKYVINFRNL